MWFHIDPSSGTLIYRQIIDQVKQAVAGGILRAGDRLPAVRDLAVELAVNPNTVAKAYQELARLGVIEMSRGRGAFVADGPRELPSAKERLDKLLPAVDRLVAEAYHLGVSDEDVKRLVKSRLASRREGPRNA